MDEHEVGYGVGFCFIWLYTSRALEVDVSFLAIKKEIVKEGM